MANTQMHDADYWTLYVWSEDQRRFVYDSSVYNLDDLRQLKAVQRQLTREGTLSRINPMKG